MRAAVQRVSRARVTVDGSVTGEITTGLLILLGVGRDDTSAVAAVMAEKIANLRIFEDDQRKMNRSLLDVKGSALVVSQFTLFGGARATQTELCRRSAGRTSKEPVRKICGSAVPVGSHRRDWSFRRNDVRGIGQRRSGDHPFGL